MPVPVVYRKSNESSIASYSFYDSMAGVGYKTFNGVSVLSGAVLKYALIPDLTNTRTFSTQSASAQDLDFDMDINMPATIAGSAIIAIPCGVVVDTGTSNFFAKLYLVRDGVETQLGTEISGTFATGGTSPAYANWVMLCGKIAFDTTTLKPGDKLRVTWIATDPGGSAESIIYHDPTQVLAGATIPISKMQVSIPFKIDL